MEVYDELEKALKEMERLKQCYCELKEKCNRGECDCTHEEYNNMCEENIKMDLEIERLKEEYVMLQNASDEVEEEKDKEIERQKEIIRQLDIKNLELTTIIKEAINYIDNNTYYKDHKGHINIDGLYIILKGVDKE